MRVTIEHRGYEMVVETDEIEQFELSTTVVDPHLKLDLKLKEVPEWRSSPRP